MDAAIMRRFVVQAIGATALAILFVALFNFAIDPYGVFNSPRIAGLNANKPKAIGDPLMVKTYLADRARPNTALFGNSTTMLGFDPASSLWAPADRPVFNFGVPGTNALTSLRLLQQVAAHHPPRLIVLGLNFDDTVAPVAAQPLTAVVKDRRASFEERLRVLADGRPNPRLWHGHLRDGERMLLSLKAFGDSLITVALQGDETTSHINADGRMTSGNFVGLVRAEGQGALFAQKYTVRATKLAGYHGYVPYDLGPVAAILDFAHRIHARVIIVIPPGHAHDLELIALAGLLDEYARWQTQLTTLVAAHAAVGDDATLWDFNGFSPYTLETVPPPGLKGDRMRWWWETSHFKAELGALIVARILGHSDANFGLQLTPANSGATAAALISGEAEFRASRPAEAAHLAAIYAGAARKTCKPGAKCGGADDAE